MACDITQGRIKACKKSIGGIVNAFFVNFAKDAFTILNGEVTAIDIAVTEVFQYALRGDENVFSEAFTSNRNTGVSLSTQTLVLQLKKLDKDTSNEVKLMAHGTPQIIVESRDGTYQLLGLTDGMDLTDSNIGTGGAKEDFNGYNLTFTGVEKDMAPFLDATTVTALLGLVSATNIDPTL